jgi:D-proline reductase (dithiol) PrdB
VADAKRDLNLHGKAWLAFAIGPQRSRPTFHRLAKSLAESRLALVTTGGFVPSGGEPFNTGKRGDPTFRAIAVGVEVEQLEIHHPHYDRDLPRRDINVLFPIPLCQKLAGEGVIKELAARHYSFMGYVPLTRKLERTYAPQLAQLLRQQEVDVVLLTPA